MPSSVDLREDSERELSVTDSGIKLVFGTAQSDPSFPRDDFLPSGHIIPWTDRRSRLSPAAPPGSPVFGGKGRVLRPSPSAAPLLRGAVPSPCPPCLSHDPFLPLSSFSGAPSTMEPGKVEFARRLPAPCGLRRFAGSSRSRFASARPTGRGAGERPQGRRRSGRRTPSTR